MEYEELRPDRNFAEDHSGLLLPQRVATERLFEGPPTPYLQGVIAAAQAARSDPHIRLVDTQQESHLID